MNEIAYAVILLAGSDVVNEPRFRFCRVIGRPDSSGTRGCGWLPLRSEDTQNANAGDYDAHAKFSQR